jgi:hypothetical protein
MGFEKAINDGVLGLFILSQSTMYEMVRSVKLWHTRQKTTTTIKGKLYDSPFDQDQPPCHSATA